jgi:hypothetical protein
LAHGAVGFVLSTLAVVIVVEAPVDAHSTVMAMLKILRSTNPTESAIFAMIRFFIVRHPQVAYAAVVFSKLNSTLNAIISEIFLDK